MIIMYVVSSIKMHVGPKGMIKEKIKSSKLIYVLF